MERNTQSYLRIVFEGKMKLFWNKEWADFANVCLQYWADRKKVPTLYTFISGTKFEIREILESIAHVTRKV